LARRLGIPVVTSFMGHGLLARLARAPRAPRVLPYLQMQPPATFVDDDAPLGGVGVRVNTRREFAVALERVMAKRGRFQLIDATLPRQGQRLSGPLTGPCSCCRTRIA